MHVFEAALYFVYYFILLLGIMTTPDNNIWQSAHQSLSKTPNNSTTNIYFMVVWRQNVPIWVSFMILFNL